MKTFFLAAMFAVFGVLFGQNTVKDFDGNVYRTAKFGEKEWMAENLRVQKYLDGDFIFTKVEGSWMDWGDFDDGAYIKGALRNGIWDTFYNWYAVKDERNICPKGWHVSTISDWDALIKHINPKESLNNNTAAKKLLAGVPSSSKNVFKVDLIGVVMPDGDLTNYSYVSTFWAVDEKDPDKPKAIYLNKDNASVDIMEYSPKFGFSVRCVKD